MSGAGGKMTNEEKRRFKKISSDLERAMLQTAVCFPVSNMKLLHTS